MSGSALYALILVVMQGNVVWGEASVVPPYMVVGEFKSMDNCVKAALQARVIQYTPGVMPPTDERFVGSAVPSAKLFCIQKSE